MGFAKALLSVLLLTSAAVYGGATTALPPIPPHHHVHYSHPVASPAHPPTHGHGHHHHHPPAVAPVHPPVHAPTHSPVHPPMHHHHHGHPPTHTPVHAPAHPPAHHSPMPHPPVPSPVHPPKYPPKKPFPRSFVAVQGVVYCKSCKYSGVDTLLGATPLLGATLKLQCNNTKYPLVVKTTTDKNGYFFITAPKTITTYGAHKCKVSLVSSSSATCSKPSDFHAGIAGALLRPLKPFLSMKKQAFLLYNVGPFAFEPKCH